MRPDSMIAWASLIMATQGLAVIDASFTIELGTERFQTEPTARRSAGKSLANSPLEFIQSGIMHPDEDQRVLSQVST